MTGRTRGRGCTEAFVVVAVLLLCVGFVVGQQLQNAVSISCGVKCGNNLRKIGLAARQYADAERAFPHVGDLGALQGGVESRDGPRALRALVWRGDLAAPETFICPLSYDMYIAHDDKEPRRWFWDGQACGSADVSPLGSDGLVDPPLEDTTELSYGWTRRGLGANVRSTAPLAADRSCRVPAEEPSPGQAGKAADGGNHEDGVYVVAADGSVSFVYGDDSAAARLTSVDADGGALGIRPVKAEPSAVAASRWAGLHERGTGRFALAFVPSLLVMAFFVFRQRRRDAKGGA